MNHLSLDNSNTGFAFFALLLQAAVDPRHHIEGIQLKHGQHRPYLVKVASTVW